MRIDFHSHILPGIDDGSASVEESIAMLQMEADHGVTHVVATPHFYASDDKPMDFISRRDEAERALRNEMNKVGGLPQLLVGAEVSYFRGMSNSEFLPLLTIQNKKCIMIEMGPAPWTESVFEELSLIHRQLGITPIIAHIDRYIAPFHTYHIPQRLAQLPVLVQANASFFLDRSTARMAVRMLRSDQIHLLGSDCHSLKYRKPNLGPAHQIISQRLGLAGENRLQAYGRMALSL